MQQQERDKQKLAGLAARMQLIQQNRMSRPGLGDEFANSTASDLIEFQQRVRKARSVAVVTGFYIRDAVPPAAETDGPTSCLNLCYNLMQQGKRVVLCTELCCAGPIKSTARTLEAEMQLPQLEICTPQSEGFARYVDETEVVIFVEKVGPSASGRCLSMRAIDVSEFNSKEYAEWAASAPYSFGVGDGGNEIGCGRFSFVNLRPAEIKCVTKTAGTLLCDISNFGGHLLSWLVATPETEELCGKKLSEARMLHLLVQSGAVDGVKGKAQETVDGMEFGAYDAIIQRIWE